MNMRRSAKKQEGVCNLRCSSRRCSTLRLLLEQATNHSILNPRATTCEICIIVPVS